MPYIITDTRDAKKGSVLTFGAGTTANTTGTQTLTAGTYEYTDFTLNSGQTLTVAHNVIIKCTGTFTLNAGAIITYQDYTGTPVYAATNGYYSSSSVWLNGGGGAGSSRSGAPSQFGGVSNDIEQQRIGPYDYHSYSAISNTGPSNVVTTSNAPVSINDALSNNMAGGRGGNGGAGVGVGGYGKGAMKIMANRVVINGTVNAIGNNESGGTNNQYGGSGGGGFLWVVTGTFSGTGAINCIATAASGGGTGGHGRFRLDYCFGTPSTWNTVGNLQTSNSVLTNYKSLTFVGGGAIGF